MRRRELLLLAGGVLVAGGAGFQLVRKIVISPMTTELGTPPWHLWGNSTSGHIDVPGTGQFDARKTQQITQVRYKRPDTWTFLLKARIFNYQDTGATPKNIQVVYELQLGEGLITTVLTGFEHFQFVTVPPNTINLSEKFCTEVIAPPAFSNPQTVDALRTRISELPAQNIQATCTVAGGIVLGEPYSFNFEVSAQFAPKVHVRPEWFRGHFPGGEDKGQ